ncbi:ribonuclease H-like domain-containing protein [Tanacetum coccineum]
MYCLVVTDDYSRFTWVFFLATKDETSGILKSFITGIENLVDRKVKVIRCDNGTEFKNRETNRLIEVIGSYMLADSKLPTTFWAEAVNTACYVQNRVLVVKPHNKTPYELFHGRTPTLSFMRPFGYPVTILNTIDHLGKFDGKADEGFFVGYSLNSKAFRVFNSRTRIVEENLHIRFSESTPNVVGSRPDWLFDIDALTRTMNYEPISSHDDGSKPSSDDGKKVDEDPRKDSECKDQEKEDNVNSTNTVNAAGTNEVNVVGGKTSIELPFDPNMSALEYYSIFDYSSNDKDDGAEADMNNLDTTIREEPKKMSSMGELTFFLGLQVYQKKDGIFISKDKYVVEILKKFRFTEVKTTSTLMETQKPLLKDEDGEEVDVHIYQGSKAIHSDSDYAGASLDRKSTTGGCQLLRCRLISWQCRKQTVVANSIIEAEYVAASSYCGQVLWIQNQLLDYGSGLTYKNDHLNHVFTARTLKQFDVKRHS